MREKTKIEDTRRTGRNKGKNKRKSMPGVCSSHLLFWSNPIPNGVPTTMYIVLQFN